MIWSAGYSVEVFASASEFLAIANLAAEPSCLALDVELPDINGLQLQRDLGGACPIIFITGYGDITMTARAMKAVHLIFFPNLCVTPSCWVLSSWCSSAPDSFTPCVANGMRSAAASIV